MPLVEKVRRKIGDYKYLALSHAGKKSSHKCSSCLSLQSCNFCLLIAKINGRTTIFSSFLWRNSHDKKPIYWTRRQVIESKSSGGLGVRNVHYLNKALLAKQAVRIHNPKLLVSKLLRAKYKGMSLSLAIEKHKLRASSWRLSVCPIHGKGGL